MEYREHLPEQSSEVPPIADAANDPRETGDALQPVVVSRTLPSYDMLPLTEDARTSVERRIGGLLTDNPEHAAGNSLEPPFEPPHTTYGEAGDAEEPFGVRRFHTIETPDPLEQMAAGCLVEAAAGNTLERLRHYADPTSPLVPTKPATLPLDTINTAGGAVQLTITSDVRPIVQARFTTHETAPVIHEVTYAARSDGGYIRENQQLYQPAACISDMGIDELPFEDQRQALTEYAADGTSLYGVPIGPELLGLQEAPLAQPVGADESQYLHALLERAEPAPVSYRSIAYAIEERYSQASIERVAVTKPADYHALTSQQAERLIEAAGVTDALVSLIDDYHSQQGDDESYLCTGPLPGYDIRLAAGYHTAVTTEGEFRTPYLHLYYGVAEKISFDVIGDIAYVTWQHGSGGSDGPSAERIPLVEDDGQLCRTVPASLHDIGQLARFLRKPRFA